MKTSDKTARMMTAAAVIEINRILLTPMLS